MKRKISSSRLQQPTSILNQTNLSHILASNLLNNCCKIFLSFLQNYQKKLGKFYLSLQLESWSIVSSQPDRLIQDHTLSDIQLKTQNSKA